MLRFRGKENVILCHKLTNCAETSPYPINISPFCCTHNQEPAASIKTRLFHLEMWGDRDRGGWGREKLSRGKYLARSSQSLIKVNWSVERTHSSGSSITGSIVSVSLSVCAAGIRQQSPRNDRSCHTHNTSSCSSG